MTCLNFAGTGSRISLPAVSSCRRVKLLRKIALNSNGEVNYRELARRPWSRWFLCVLLLSFLKHFNHMYLWNQLTNLNGITVKSSFGNEVYIVQPIRKNENWIWPSFDSLCLIASHLVRQGGENRALARTCHACYFDGQVPFMTGLTKWDDGLKIQKMTGSMPWKLIKWITSAVFPFPSNLWFVAAW